MKSITISLVAALLILASGTSSSTSISELYNLAVEADPTSISSKINVDVAREQQNQAEAALYPQASLSASITKNHLTGDNTSTQNYLGKSLNLSATQAIYDTVSYRENERRKIQTDISQLENKQSQGDVIVKVIDLYLQVIEAEDTLDLVIQNKKSIQSNLSQLEALYDKQLVSIVNVYETQARLDLALSETIEAKNQVAVAYERLYEIIGQRVTGLQSLKDNIAYELPDKTLTAWLEQAKSQNHTIIATKQQEDLLKKEIEVRDADYYPVVSLTARYSFQDIGSDNTPRPETHISSIGINVSQQLYQKGISARKRETFHRLALVEQSAIEITRRLEQQVREYYLNLNADKLKIQATERQIRSEKKRIDAMKKSYQYSVVTTKDVLDADTAFYRAKVEHQKAKYSFIKNFFNLKNTAGNLTKEDITRLNKGLL